MPSTITLTAADGFSIPTYVAQPQGTPRGAIVVLQEIFGVNSHIRAVADGYAAQGYVAIAPAMFERLHPGLERGYEAADITLGRELKAAAETLPAPGVLQDVAAAVAYGAGFGPVGVVGYCWGGLLAWRAACGLSSVSAAVAYYGGGVTTPAEVARQAQCPVMAHFGEQDHAIPLDGVHAFAKAHPQVLVHTYDAEHGFNCDHRGAYNAPAAALALERTQQFFAQHLRS
jgi:carboxymethylenebutenolidase